MCTIYKKAWVTISAIKRLHNIINLKVSEALIYMTDIKLMRCPIKSRDLAVGCKMEDVFMQIARYLPEACEVFG